MGERAAIATAVWVCTAGGGLSSGLSLDDAAGDAAAQPSDRASAAAQINNMPRLNTLTHTFIILVADVGKGIIPQIGGGIPKGGKRKLAQPRSNV